MRIVVLPAEAVRARSISGILGVLGLVAFGPTARIKPLSLPAACAASAIALEQAWGGTGAWRRLAPYPVPREASPTDSVGVWLERRMPSPGTVELRRVSIERTDVAVFGEPGCSARVTVHHRTFDSSATSRDFTDARLRDLLHRDSGGMIYVWSPRMPLSIQGIAEARAAARSLGIAFTAVVAEADSAELLGVDSSLTHTLGSLELVYRNATIHYPTATFYRDGAIRGSAIPGYHSRETYAAFAREQLEANPGTTGSTEAPTFWVDHKANVATVRSAETVRPVGFFFKPVAGSDLVSYTSQVGSYLFDLVTRREQRIPGNVDPVPTPDGRFITRPGLMFYPTAALVAGDTVPMFVDRDLPDEYQTMSILKQARDAVRYRVVTGWRTGVRYRDYDVSFDAAGKPTHIQPLGQTMNPCADRSFALPISSKALGSKEMGLYDNKTQTNRIVEITDDGQCVDRLDLGFASGKLAFSYDGAAVAFATSRVDVDAEGFVLKPQEMFYKDALVLYRKTGRIVSLSSNRALAGMTFPEFLPDGKAIILDQASRLRHPEVIRVVEVK
jgi:hypothetical protein